MFKYISTKTSVSTKSFIIFSPVLLISGYQVDQLVIELNADCS